MAACEATAGETCLRLTNKHRNYAKLCVGVCLILCLDVLVLPIELSVNYKTIIPLLFFMIFQCFSIPVL